MTPTQPEVKTNGHIHFKKRSFSETRFVTHGLTTSNYFQNYLKANKDRCFNLGTLDLMSVFRYCFFISKIYPLWFRSTGISLATLMNWTANIVVSFTYLPLESNLHQVREKGLSLVALSQIGTIEKPLELPDWNFSRLLRLITDHLIAFSLLTFLIC